MRLKFDFGWFPAVALRLLSFSLLESGGEYGFVLFHLQIAKFCAGVSWAPDFSKWLDDAHDQPLTSRACADAAEYPKTQKG